MKADKWTRIWKSLPIFGDIYMSTNEINQLWRVCQQGAPLNSERKKYKVLRILPNLIPLRGWYKGRGIVIAESH
jgi:hypothetical protein